MKRKEYIKPEMQVIQLQSRTQLLAGSTMEIYDDGFPNEDDYAGPGDIL